jgi:hypothetical protein
VCTAGRFYLGWVVRQADWQRIQGAPVRLAAPQLPINCLEIARRQPWVQPSDVLQRVDVQRYMGDRWLPPGCMLGSPASVPHATLCKRSDQGLPGRPC